jgi:uncharacterized transporter YbjL
MISLDIRPLSGLTDGVKYERTREFGLMLFLSFLGLQFGVLFYEGFGRRGSREGIEEALSGNGIAVTDLMHRYQV